MSGIGSIINSVNNALGGAGPGLPNAKPLPDLGIPGGPGGLHGADPGLPGAPGGPTAGPDPANPGLPGDPGGTPGAPNNGPLADLLPDLRPDTNPLSRMLQGQSAQTPGSSTNFSTGPTQYPPPTLSERALNFAAGQASASIERPATLSPVTAAATTQGAAPQSSALPASVPGSAAGSAATASAATAHGTATAHGALAAGAQAGAANAPLAAALNADALAAQQNLLARLAAPQHANAPNPAAVAPPPSETGMTLPPVNTHTINNDPRNLPLAANDRIVQPRGEGGPGTPTYTGEGPARRASRRGGGVDNATMTHWLWSFGRGGVHRPTHDREPDRVVVRALQWLFWVLTVIAYVCLAMAIVLMLPSGSLEGGRAGGAGGGGIALLLGVCVAAGAWWLGRRLNRR